MAIKNINKEPREGEHKSAAYRSKGDPAEYFVMVKLDGSEPEEVVTGEDGREYEKTDHIPIDVNAIPDCVRNDLAAATLEFIRDALKQPGVREMLDKRIAAKKASHKGNADKN